MRNTPSTVFRLLSATLILLGVGLVLLGYFSPWVPHPAAGLALTGFEIAEWIKFAPQVRMGVSPLKRADFYWPPTVAAIGLAALAASHPGRPRWSHWAPIILAAILSLLPFPLLEEVNSLGGVQANLGRLGLVILGLLATTYGWIAVEGRLPAKVGGIALALTAGTGLVLVSRAFGAAEPIVESLLNHSIDPGLGYHLTRGGMLLLFVAGIIQSSND